MHKRDINVVLRCSFTCFIPVHTYRLNTRIVIIFMPSHYPSPIPSRISSHPTNKMRIFASIVTVAGLVAVASADINACPSRALLHTRGGGFFDKLDAKISSWTKSGNDVRTKVVRNARHQQQCQSAEEDLFCLHLTHFYPRLFFPPGYGQGLQVD